MKGASPRRLGSFTVAVAVTVAAAGPAFLLGQPIRLADRTRIKDVGEYNSTVQKFPTSIGASMRGRAVRPTFEAPAGSENAPEVKF